MTPEERAYDVLNRVAAPGWGDEITAAVAQAIREAVAEERERCIKIAHLVWLDDSGRIRGLVNAGDVIYEKGQP
jgi:hypothetical protein